MCKILVIANYFCRGHDLSFLFFYVDQYLLALRLCQNWVDTVGLSSRGCLRPAISSEITNYFHLQLMMQLWNITVNVGCNLAHILVKFTNSLFFVRQVEGNIYQQCRQRSAGLSVFEKVSPPPPPPPPPPLSSSYCGVRIFSELLFQPVSFTMSPIPCEKIQYHP